MSREYIHIFCLHICFVHLWSLCLYKRMACYAFNIWFWTIYVVRIRGFKKIFSHWRREAARYRKYHSTLVYIWNRFHIKPISYLAPPYVVNYLSCTNGAKLLNMLINMSICTSLLLEKYHHINSMGF